MPTIHTLTLMTSFTYSRGRLATKAQCRTNFIFICSGNHVGEMWRAFGGTRLFFPALVATVIQVLKSSTEKRLMEVASSHMAVSLP